MELAVSGGPSRGHPPHHHPHPQHQGHPYDAYPPSPPRASQAAAPLPANSSKRREQQQQEYAYQTGGQLQNAAPSGYPPPPGYYPAQHPPPHGSPGLAPHGGPSAASGSSRHAYPESGGYPLAPPMAPPMHQQAHMQHPHHPQHYPHHLGPPQHMGPGYYEGEMMDIDAHYAAQQQQQHMGYPIPPPGMADPRMGYPPPMPAHHQHDPRSHEAYQGGPHPAHLPPNPPAKTKTKSGSRKDKEKREKQAGGATGKAAKGEGKGQAAKEAKAEAAAQAKEAAAAAAAAAGATTESKKDKKKREVVDRIFRMHAETMDNREGLFQHLQHQFLAEHTTLLTSPLLSRQYQLNLSFLTLQREAALRRIALLHAHQVETARKTYELEKTKVEEEAKQARKTVRERLTAAVDERRKKLKDEKESGEGASDTLLESSSRPHATRKLRNKHTGTSRRLALAAGDIDSGDESSVAGGPSGSTTQGKDRSKDGSIILAGAAASTNANGLLLAGSKAMDASAPILGLHGLPELSLLQSSLRVFENDNPARVNGSAAKGKGSRKAGGKKRRGAVPDRPPSPAPDAEEEHLSKKAKRELERDRLSFLALASSSLPATLTGTGTGGGGAGGGMLSSGPGPGGSKTIRWEPGRSVLQLTGAKDYEAESDLIRIRGGIGGGKRRRGAAAAA